ncbi:LysR substrate-binding domain-containing protein [Alcanivorax sp. S6407]|uniref:LysR substrate-binding domain-containing protein n=1 Tax=Alcanivorax sp. S6407 TaxID=2926424 RepID=UPI001FF30391|nr:LysR substrate-binding domain-containing protein [Alcanivorax sp. S6407]MCK0153962.1 LysR substrate-binding domain-containing protein [Alcanivorax sp. S6407]
MKLNLRSIDLNLLPVFAAIMDAGQLSRAAEQLGMSQPAISAALQRLRHTFADELFVRTRQGMEPTPRARELHEQLAPQLNALREALDPGNRFDPATSQRHFRIISVDYFEMVVLPPLLARIRQQAPDVLLEIVPSGDTMADDLHKARADIAVDAFIPDDDRLMREVLLDEELMVVARQGHPTIKGRCSKAQFLKAEHVVLPDRNRRLPLDQILDSPGWQRRTGARVTHFVSMLAATAGSDMIATAPRRLAEQYAGALQVQVLPFPVAVPPVPIYQLWSPALDQDPAHQWLREQLSATLKAL